MCAINGDLATWMVADIAHNMTAVEKHGLWCDHNQKITPKNIPFQAFQNPMA